MSVVPPSDARLLRWRVFLAHPTDRFSTIGNEGQNANAWHRTNLRLHKLYDLRSYLIGALHDGSMATSREDLQLRMRNELMHPLPLVERHDTIICAPDNQHGHFQLGQ
jgi:hypothetical protein